MVFSFKTSQQFGNVIVAEARAQTERPAFHSVGLGLRRLEHLLQANAQCGIDDLLEGLVKLGCARPCFSRNIRVER